tara:strand:+ start:952 stop:4170 length:3219 start_codon:yes stop_codon:yes gene_type:complete
MATNQKQEVELLIKAGTEGLKSIGQLVKELEALGQDTGEASEQMEGLAGSLKGLRDQQKLVKQFADLKSQTKELGEQQAKAKTNATELGKALAATEKPTKAQRVEFEKARKASKDADQAWQNNQVQLNGLRTSLSEAGVSTSNLSDEQRRIKREIAGVDEEISSVTGELTQMRDSAKAAAKGSRQLGDDVDKSGKRVGKFRERIQGLGPVLSTIGSGLKTTALAVTGFVAAAGASIVTLTLFSRSQGEAAREIRNTSDAIDISAQKLQEFQAAGKEFNVEGDKISDVLKDITEKIGDFSATGGGEAANVFEQLNLGIEDFRSLAPDQQILKLSEAITQLDSRSEQVFFLESLASDASLLLPLLDDNAAALKRISQEAQASGAILSDKELADLVEANEIYNSIDLKLKGLVNRIGVELAPAVAKATEKVLGLFESAGGGDALVNLFTRLTDSATGFLGKLATNSGSIVESFSTLTKTISFFGNTATAVFRGVQSIAAGLLTFMATGISNLMSAIQGLAFALNKVGIVSDSAYGAIAAKAEAARATVVDLAKQTVEYGKKSKEAAAAAVKAFEDTGTAAKKTKDEIEEAASVTITLAENFKTAGEAGEEALQKQEQAAARARRGLSEYGVDVKEVMTGVTKEAQLAIDDVGELAAKIKGAGLTSKQSAEAFKNGFSEAIEAVNTKEGLTELQEKIKGLKEAGEIGAVGANAALETIRKKALELDGLTVDVGLDEVKKDAEEAGEAIDDLAVKAKNAKEEATKARDEFRSAWGDAFGAALTAARTGVTQLSAAARNMFETKIKSNAFVEETVNLREELEKTTREVQKLQKASDATMSTKLSGWFIEIKLAAAEVKKEYLEQSIALQSLNEKMDAGQLSMQDLDYWAERADRKFNLLDKQTLSGLKSAIDAARNKIESLESSAESTLSSLQQRLADISGDTERAQQLQYEAEKKRLVELQKQAEQEGADNAAADYAKALDQLQKINAIEQKNRQEAENEREKAAADRQRQQEQAERERQQFERQRNTTTNKQQNQASSPRQTIVLQTPTGGQTEIQTEDPEGLLRILEQAGLRSAQ